VPPSASRTLVVTNDYPPRPGGIQTFVHELLRRLPPEDVVVLASTWRGAAEFDAEQACTVIREPTKVLLPTPAVGRRAAALLAEHECTSVLFGAAAPLGLIGPTLRDAGAQRLVALTHGHEAGWAGIPGMRQVLRAVGARLDVITYLGEYTRQRIADAVGADAATRMVQLTPGVDDTVFRPDVDTAALRARYELGDRPVVVCVSRLMPRKGQDVLVEAWPRVREQVPDAVLLLVGGGPHRDVLQRRVSDLRLVHDVRLTGSVPWSQLPAHYALGQVFAMPCRTRHRGLDVEGLGIVYLEASATGLPVIAGRSGGAPDAVLDGETGLVVDGTDTAEVATAVTDLLIDGDRRAAMGAAGRAWVARAWRWERQVQRLARLLDPGVAVADLVRHDEVTGQ
jgi:phosphatidylinositol alpha-1,6-mannosyltransferase